MQRFFPSEFGHDVNRADPIEPGLTMYNEKRSVRRFLEESGVPFTYICCNSIASWPYYDNIHPSEVLPPMDFFQIYGDGNVKGKQTVGDIPAGRPPAGLFASIFHSYPPPPLLYSIVHTSKMLSKLKKISSTSLYLNR